MCTGSGSTGCCGPKGITVYLFWDIFTSLIPVTLPATRRLTKRLISAVAEFNLADIYFTTMTRWGRWLDPPANEMRNIRPVYERVIARPSFKRAMESQPGPWRLARPLGGDALARLTDAFGIVATPDGFGGFDHNAALHVVDRSCRLVRVLDADDVDGAADAVRALARQDP